MKQDQCRNVNRLFAVPTSNPHVIVTLLPEQIKYGIINFHSGARNGKILPNTNVKNPTNG